MKRCYTFKCYVCVCRPSLSHRHRELSFMPVLCGARVSQVDVLLGVLPVEIQIMRHLTKMRGA